MRSNSQKFGNSRSISINSCASESTPPGDSRVLEVYLKRKCYFWYHMTPLEAVSFPYSLSFHCVSTYHGCIFFFKKKTMPDTNREKWCPCPKRPKEAAGEAKESDQRAACIYQEGVNIRKKKGERFCEILTFTKSKSCTLLIWDGNKSLEKDPSLDFGLVE